LQPSYASDRIELIPKEDSSSSSEEVEIFIANNNTTLKENPYFYKDLGHLKNKLQSLCTTRAKVYFGIATVSMIIILIFLFYIESPTKNEEQAIHLKKNMQ
jgi:hypothetical protein